MGDFSERGIMRRTLTIFILIFTVMFSSPSYAEWTKVSEGVSSGNNYYLDLERIRKHDGYVYYWVLLDKLRPSKTGTLSSKLYFQGDCKLFRNKMLSLSLHKEPMGGGIGRVDNRSDKGWRYPSPNSNSENILKSVCSR